MKYHYHLGLAGASGIGHFETVKPWCPGGSGSRSVLQCSVNLAYSWALAVLFVPVYISYHNCSVAVSNNQSFNHYCLFAWVPQFLLELGTRSFSGLIVT